MCSLLDREKKIVHMLARDHGQRVACQMCPFTEREKLILHRLAQGDTVRQTAVRLSLAARTVASHWKRISQKLGMDAAACQTALRCRTS